MTKPTQFLFAGVAVLSLMGAVAFFGLSPFGKTVIQQTFGAAPAGSNYTDQKLYAVTVNLANPGANGTSTSILNPSATDYFVTGISVGCENVGTSKTAYTGTGLAALTLTVATSATAAPATNANTNVVNENTLGTSTPQFVVSSTTPATGVVGTNGIWAAGSYMTFTTNATNTALCTFGVNVLGS